ncbi:rhamnogalacturonate lyase [Teratosphaeria nubilosa]|uniref:rhamnogalacturonan endolyase n=1 Tax=Teratosphaeria nubilosa TaxID=161662 RepID=A0A6G1L2A0_9PEZI|nr:rhamnogalacturonate lyase [Teratosphaeria nubilosa]
MSLFIYLVVHVALFCFLRSATAFQAIQDANQIVLANERLHVSLNKSIGIIDQLSLDNQDLLGPPNYAAKHGLGPYLDCYCTPKGAYTPGSNHPQYAVLQGNDSSGIPWAGVVMSEVYPPTGQILEQYWFLHGEETGLHSFSRLVYRNETGPESLGSFQEFRTLFRPNTHLWTHLSTNKRQNAPLPYHNPANAVDGGSGDVTLVQDTTWRINNASDPYVIEESDYFSKYIFSDGWRDHLVHGLFSDGRRNPGGSTFGAWLVMNTKETYFGGPLHSDLTVDGIIYNYIISNHHGDQTPNITNGLDYLAGPQFYYFNRGPPNAKLQDLRKDTLQFASPMWNADFYDSIAPHVPGYVPTAGRGSWKGSIRLPRAARRPLAVLSANGFDFQDNVFNTSAGQYWADINPDGLVEIPRVKAGTYRLTVYADGVFGQFEQDNIVVEAGQCTETDVEWQEDCHGIELWRIGNPDKSSGEYRHGFAPDLTHPLHPAQYRLYWGIYDYVADFPHGVNFQVGQSDVSVDLNYVHWSVYGGRGSVRPDVYVGNGNVNNWTILFDVDPEVLRGKTHAYLTIQLAAAKTAAGNTDVYKASQRYANLPYTVAVNHHELEPWIIPYYQSSSCAVRSAVTCYNLVHHFVFDASFLLPGGNKIILSLPFNATDYESAVLSNAIYVQYDALRLQVE